MNAYLTELLGALEQTIITEKEKNHAALYDEGYQHIVSWFLEQKEKPYSQTYFIGNGGSSAIASHMTADFMKNGGMRTNSLYDHAVVTCMGNDYGYEYVFSKPLDFLLTKEDLLVSISSSGESANILNAIRVAKEKNAKTIAFTGFEQRNTASRLADYSVYVPSKKYGIVESVHNLILQQVVDMIMENG